MIFLKTSFAVRCGAAFLLFLIGQQPAPGAESAASILARIDKAAAQFRGMTAHVEHTTHTAVIDDNSTESGTVMVRKVGPGEVQGLLQFTKPDQRFILFRDRKALIYTPASKSAQNYDLGKFSQQIDQFFMIGFGTSRAEIEKGYKVEVKGKEKTTTKIELVPRSAEALKRLTRMELWIADDGDYPLKEKLYEPSGDYVLVVYSEMKINPQPALKDSDLRLSLPKDVQIVHPQN